MEQIDVAILENRELIREGLSSALRCGQPFRLVSTAPTLGQGLPHLREHDPAVILTAVHLPDADGFAATQRLRREAADDPATVLIADRATAQIVMRAARAGAAGVVERSDTLVEIRTAVRTAAAGSGVVDATSMRALVRQHDPATGQALSDREHEVLRCLAAGRETRALADELTVSVHTVRNHIRNLRRKLGADTRLQAVTAALRQGILTVEDLE